MTWGIGHKQNISHQYIIFTNAPSIHYQLKMIWGTDYKEKVSH
jgi:hypothetical protein